MIPAFCGKDCGGNACPLMATLEGGRVVRISNNPSAPRHLKGCIRGFGLPQEAHAPDRVLRPLIRTGERGSGRFREASWDEALDLVAGRLTEIRAQYGPHAVLNLSSAGCLGALHGTDALLSRFLNLAGGATVLTGSYSIGAANFVLPYLLGPDWAASGLDPATLQQAQMIILWGANPLETRHGSEVPARLLEAKRRGAEVVVIDPRRTLTARRAGTWWLPCRPGTDAALMLAVLHVLLSEELADRAFLAAHAEGFEVLESHVLGRDGGPARTPRWAEDPCGVPASEIHRFARAYAAAKPALLLPGYSIQRTFAGEDAFRLTVALQLATGNFGRRGGSTGAPISRLPAPRVGKLPVPPVPGQPRLPITHWPDAVLEGRAGGYPSDLQAIYSIGGNFLNQGPDIPKSSEAFRKVAFTVCHELFLTPTARHCDVVLPAAHALEKEDIGIPWLGNFLTYKPRILPPRGEARSDYDILCALADRLGFLPAFAEGRTAAQWLQHFLDQSEVPDHDAFRRTGLYLAPDQERVGLAAFAEDPVRHPLGTPSGKVELASERYRRETGFPAIPAWRMPPAEDRHPLRLITPKVAQRTHSQGGQYVGVNTLEMHVRDAEARGIHEGDQVVLFNDRGAARLPVRCSEDLLPGVVCLPEGVWVQREASGLDLAGSANMFTGTEGTAPSSSCIMEGVPVEVRRAAMPLLDAGQDDDAGTGRPLEGRGWNVQG